MGNPIALPVESITVDGTGNPIRCQLLVMEELVNRLLSRGEKSKVAQLLRIVYEFMTKPKHIFRGLNRCMKVNGNNQADKQFDAYVLLPHSDFEYSHALADVEMLPRPSGRVFVVIARMYDHPQKGAAGEVVSWSWIDCCDGGNGLQYAPVEYASRYETHLWSAE